jgi:putative ABC transport system permease protein
MNIKVIRRIRQDWQWFLINAIGLSSALSCVLIIFIYVNRQFSYDMFHSKADRIYRLTFDTNRGAASIHPARIYGNIPEELIPKYPAIESITRIVSYKNAIIKIGEKSFYSKNAYATDSSFFKIFDFKVLTGTSENAFIQPGKAFICRSLAVKYFGNIDVVGREILVQHQQEPKPQVFTIEGVIEDFPENSHFHAELLTSFTSDNDKTTWAYTYLLLKKGANADKLRTSIQDDWKAENQTSDPVPVLYLQKLGDIHLFSQKTREMERNGDFRTIILLVIGAAVILLVTFINYLNLSRVQLISRMKTMQVKIINGASKVILAYETALESLFLSLFSITISLFLSDWVGEFLKISVFHSGQIAGIITICLVFIIMVILIAEIPLFSSKIISDIKVTVAREGLYAIPLVIQFIFGVIAIICTLVFKQQMNFLNDQHPGSRKDIIVIAENPWQVVQKYDLFKEELLKNSSIKNMTGAMESPGGDILDGVGFEMEGIQKKDGQTLNIFTIGSNFFSSLGIHPLAGTVDIEFTPSQQWESDAVDLSNLRQSENIDKHKLEELERKVGNYREKYILNQSALKMLGIEKPEDAVGKRFRINFFLPDLFPEGEVVGVVPDFHYTDLHRAERPLVVAPRKMFNYSFLITINDVPAADALLAIESTWKKINPDVPFHYEYLDESYKKAYKGEYAEERTLSLFTLISLILSSLGVYALSAFSIQRRVKEIGIRKINGATETDILLLINSHFVKWILIGLIIASPVGFILMSLWLENFAYKTSLSWWIFVLAGLIALFIIVATVSWQSWRAATRNPVDAMRYE